MKQIKSKPSSFSRTTTPPRDVTSRNFTNLSSSSRLNSPSLLPNTLLSHVITSFPSAPPPPLRAASIYESSLASLRTDWVDSHHRHTRLAAASLTMPVTPRAVPPVTLVSKYDTNLSVSDRVRHKKMLRENKVCRSSASPGSMPSQSRTTSSSPPRSMSNSSSLSPGYIPSSHWTSPSQFFAPSPQVTFLHQFFTIDDIYRSIHHHA